MCVWLHISTHTGLHRRLQASVYHCDKVQPLRDVGGPAGGRGWGSMWRFSCGGCQLSIHHRVTAKCAPVVHPVFCLQAVEARECQEEPCEPAGRLHPFAIPCQIKRAPQINQSPFQLSQS